MTSGHPGQATRRRRILPCAAAVLVLAAGGGAAGAAVTPAQLEDVRAQVEEAQHAANEAAGRQAAAEQRNAELEVEIQVVEERLRAGRAEIADLQLLLQRRAVDRYVRHSAAGGGLGVIGGGSPLLGARRDALLSAAVHRDEYSVRRLRALTGDLGEQEQVLEERKAEQAEVTAELRASAASLATELRALQRIRADMEEELRRVEAAARERERARLAAQYAGIYVATGIACPIRGAVAFVDSFGAPRATTGWHAGVDLMSPAGTPNVAVVAGTVDFHAGPVSGLGAWLTGDDGNSYLYFHLSAHAGDPRRVGQGEVIGYTGNTGDASGGPTHTHFEVHPGGGGAVNPYPSVARVC